jgi:HTH-type transcriptional regulator/antitoxin HigA
MSSLKYTIIKTRKQYDEYCLKLTKLDGAQPSKAVDDEMALLELLIDTWEKENFTPIQMDPIQLLHSLMQNQNMSRSELIGLLGIGKSALSQILSYKRGLSKTVIIKLGERFKVSQEAFNRPYRLKVAVFNRNKNMKVLNIGKKAKPA